MAAKANHSGRSHSDLPPSSADMWHNCYGWRATVAQHVETYGRPKSSAAAEEGTLAHEKMEAHLHATAPTLSPTIPAPDSPQELTHEDDEYDDLLPMIEWVYDQPGELFLESRIDFGQQFGYVDLTGTTDLVLAEPSRLTIGDLKYGRHVVEIEDDLGRTNRQLMTYLSGAVARFGKAEEYRLVILQPRAWHRDGPIREKIISHSELEVFNFELEEAIAANYQGGECTPGPWCRPYCPALKTCKAVAALSLQRFRDNPVER